jgi:hypothetical protein
VIYREISPPAEPVWTIAPRWARHAVLRWLGSRLLGYRWRVATWWACTAGLCELADASVSEAPNVTGEVEGRSSVPPCFCGGAYLDVWMMAVER